MGNHDIYPVPKKEGNYGYFSFYSYYALGAISVYGFTAASAYVAAGLSTWDTVGAICLGSCIAAFNACLGSQVGTDKYLGFTIMTRVTFGLRGAILPILNATFASVIFVSGTHFLYPTTSIIDHGLYRLGSRLIMVAKPLQLSLELLFHSIIAWPTRFLLGM